MSRALNVLIVDDSELQADVLEGVLDDLGISNVTKATNGVHAVDCFEEALKSGSAFSLVFLDIVMPEMDGQEALKRIRALEKEAGVDTVARATIIMLTSLSSPKDMMSALIDGDCNDYVVKPVAESILKAMLTKYGFFK